VEGSINIHTEVFVEFTLLWFSDPVLDIYEIPLLVDSTMLIPHENVVVLTVLSTSNVSSLVLVLFVDEEWCLPFE